MGYSSIVVVIEDGIAEARFQDHAHALRRVRALAPQPRCDCSGPVSPWLSSRAGSRQVPLRHGRSCGLKRMGTGRHLKEWARADQSCGAVVAPDTVCQGTPCTLGA